MHGHFLAAILFSLAPLAALACTAAPATWGPFTKPSGVIERYAHGEPLVIVAIGSSSISGIGATKPAHSFPARLEGLLSGHGGSFVRVLNKGVAGETVDETIGRFERDVLAHRPDLVIWQVGTNDALRGRDPVIVRAEVEHGLASLGGVPTVLMDAQFRPETPETAAQRAVRMELHDLARERGLAMLTRFDLMRGWIETGVFGTQELLASDGLHMNDRSYACLAERVSDLFDQAQ